MFEKISVDFKEVSLGAVFGVISDFADVLIVVDPAIRNKPVTVQYKDTPWDQVVNETLARYNLAIEYQKTPNRFYVHAR